MDNSLSSVKKSVWKVPAGKSEWGSPLLSSFSCRRHPFNSCRIIALFSHSPLNSWKENHSTICPDASQCSDYEPCKEHLVPALEEIEGVNHGLNLASTSSGTTTSIPEVPSDMNLRCSLPTLTNNVDGRGFCEEICNEALCCWNEQEADSCQENSACSGYAICANLLTTTPIDSSGTSTEPPPPPSDLAAICAAGNIIDLQGLEQCRQECANADCCWLEDTEFGSCSASADCETYRTQCSLMRQELNLSGSNRRRMMRLP